MSGQRRDGARASSLVFSSAGEESDDGAARAGLDNISIDYPTSSKKPLKKASVSSVVVGGGASTNDTVVEEIDQKQLSKLRAKQLQLSLVEREARRNQLAIGG